MCLVNGINMTSTIIIKASRSRSSRPNNAYMWQYTEPAMFQMIGALQIMAGWSHSVNGCRIFPGVQKQLQARKAKNWIKNDLTMNNTPFNVLKGTFLFIHYWKSRSSQIKKLVNAFEAPPPPPYRELYVNALITAQKCLSLTVYHTSYAITKSSETMVWRQVCNLRLWLYEVQSRKRLTHVK